MEIRTSTRKERISILVQTNNKEGVLQILKAGLDPNFDGGWPLRLAARHGSCDVVKILLQWGANPHLPTKAEASTLQLAVYSGLHWEEGARAWELLLSCCDSSQLADGAAVAVVFKRLAALRQILSTGRCNTNIPTTLTGRTVESLAKGYNLEHILKEVPTPVITTSQCLSPAIRQHTMRCSSERAGGPSSHRRALSPSVAQFFEQTAHQASLSPQPRQHAAAAAAASTSALAPSAPSSSSPTTPFIFTSPTFSILQ